MSHATVTLDVRNYIREGRDPFSRIMEAVTPLKPGESLRLLVPFEPRPLLEVLARSGFTHEMRPMDTGDWEVSFTRGSGVSSSPEATPATSRSPRGPGGIIQVDARGLEPPQPLVVILEAIETLGEGTELRAQTDCPPLHLYTQLEERCFKWETKEQYDGSYLTFIRRA